MTVYASVDQADCFAAYKPYKQVTQPIDSRPVTVEHLDRTTKDIFALVDALQQIVTSKLELRPIDVGAVSGKLIILRILLNAQHGVRTPQIDRNWSCS